MSDRILPAIGSTGTYELASPYNTKILPEELYTCKAIRNISEYISYNQDAKKTVYDFYGLTDADYEADVKEDMEIISLQNNKGVWLYVPARFILKYPIVNGIPYHQVAIVAKLPAIEVGKNLENVKIDMGNLLKDYIGVDSKIDIIETSRVIAVTKEVSDAMNLERETVSGGKITDRARYKELEQQQADALAKIKDLETYIENRYFGYIPPTVDFVATPKITSPALHATELGPNVTITTAQYFTSPYGPSDANDEQVSSDWQVATDPEFTDIYLQSIDDTVNLGTWTVTNLPVNTSFYIRVRFKSANIGYSHWSSVVVFNTKITYITAPVILTPVDASTANLSTTNVTSNAFVSTLAGDTHQYTDWQIARDHNFNNIVVQSMGDTVHKLAWSATPLNANQEYFLRARYSSSNGYISEWSSIVSFYTKTSYDVKPITPAIEQPLDNAINLGPNISFVGSDFAVLSGSDYHESSDWEIATDIDFTNIVLQSLDDQVNKTIKTFNNVPVNSELYIRVRYKGLATSLSDWSNIISIHTKTSYSTAPNTPVILTPSNNDIDLGPTLLVTSNPFTVSNGVDTHISSDWQISRNNSFTNIILTSVNDEVNLVKWLIGRLPANSTLYIRMRHKGATLGYSNWSNTVEILTKDSYIDWPQITLPANNASELGPVISFISTPFISSASGDKHLSSDWVIATDSNFTNIINASYGDIANKTKWESGLIPNNINVYAKVRYKGSLSGYSRWSIVIPLIMKENYIDKPIITTPISGTDNLGPTVSLVASEYHAAGSGNFHQSSDWEIASDPDFSYIHTQTAYDEANKTSWAADVIVPGRTMYGRVRYRGINGLSSEWSDAVSFNMRSEFITTPVILSPSNNAGNLGPYVSLVASELSISTGVEKHISSDWEIASDSLFTNIINNTIKDTINKTSWVPYFQLPPNATYYARVRYKGARYGTTNWSTRIKFTTAAEYIMKPVITFPANGATELGPFITITTAPYMAVAGGNIHDSSDWEMATDAEFTNDSIIHSLYNSNTSKTSWSISSPNILPVNSTLYIRVRYKGSVTGLSEWSNIGIFTTKSEYIKTPEITQPTDGSSSVAVVVLKSKLFSSLVQNETHTSTDWEVSTDPDFTSPAGFILGNTTTPNGYNANGDAETIPGVSRRWAAIQGLAPKLKLYARVRYHGSISGASKWSNIISFTTMDTGIDTPHITTLTTSTVLKTWPNLSVAATPYHSADATNIQTKAIWELLEDIGTSLFTQDINSAPFNTWNVDLSTITGLVPSNTQTKYVRVKYIGTSSESDWGNSFTIGIDLPSSGGSGGVGDGTVPTPQILSVDIGTDSLKLTAITSTAYNQVTHGGNIFGSAWQIADSDTFTNILNEVTYTPEYTLTFNVSLFNLTPGNTYYVRVRQAVSFDGSDSLNTAVYSSWSAPYAFTMT